MGLSVNSLRLGTIADNIANSETYGYKRAVSDFQSMVVRSRPNAYAAGGVRAEISRDVTDEGSLISTGNATDLAIAGRGLLAVTDEAGTDPQNMNRELLLTATGSFEPDENGFLRTASGLFLLGWPADSRGDIGAVSRQSSESLEPVRVTTSAFTSTPTTRIGMGLNLPADATQAGGTGDPYEITTEYFDNFGRGQVLTARFTPNIPATGASNLWSVEILDNSTGTEVSLATFDVSFRDEATNGGAIDDVTNAVAYDPVTGAALPGDPTDGAYNRATGEVTIETPSGPISLFVGEPDGRSGMTQYATGFSPYNLTKDGAAIGNLVSVEVDERGQLQAIYDTGFRQTLYQIPVADVPNLNGLTPMNSQAFRISQESGDVYFWDAGEGPTGEMVGFGLMESTTDIASELTQLIETQRAYSSNAKIIQTVDELLQETNNIIR
jgi:flagellar hook protein FlgE